MSSIVKGVAPSPPPWTSEKYFRGTIDSIKLSDTFDCTEGGTAAIDGPAAVVVDAAEIDDDEADGAGGVLPLFAFALKSDIIVDDDDLIESSTDAADDETDLYMESNFDDTLLSLFEPEPHDRSFDAGFLCRGCFDIVEAIF